MPYSSLRSNWPDLHKAVMSEVQENPRLAEAVKDYERACGHLCALAADATDRHDWTEIRDELELEIRRLSRASTP